MEEHFPAELERAYTTQTQQRRPSIEARLESLSESQDQLASARRQLLITRERVRTASRNVRLKRVDAGDAEVVFMNRLRQFINDSRDGIPETLLDAYNAVAQGRDILGEIEEDYLQAERDLTGAEWRFMDQENGFYQFDIWSIVNEEDSEGIAAPQDQTYGFPSHPPPPQSPLGPIAYAAGWLDTSRSPDTPCPAHSPPLRSAVSTLDVTATSMPPSEVYFAELAEIEKLRKGFDQIRHDKASSIVWQEGGGVLYADGVDTVDLDPAAPTSDYFKILNQLSVCEANAQQLKVAAMAGIREAPDWALARRYSDPMYDFTATQPCSASMRRTQTESAVHSVRNDPTTKEKIREWSLKYLKESAVQKCIYLNALEDREVANLADEDWRARATRFWSNDSVDEIGGGNERCETSTIGTSHEPVSCSDVDVVESAPASPELQPPHREMRPGDRINDSTEGLELCEIPEEDNRDASSMSSPLLSLSQHHRLVDMRTKTGNTIASSNGRSPDVRQQANEGQVPVDDVAEQIRCTCPPEHSDAAKRKDSVQGTDMDHHPNCAITVRYNLGFHTQLPAQISRDFETTRKTSTAHARCDLTQRKLTADFYPSTPVGSNVAQPIRMEPAFDSKTQDALLGPYMHAPKAATPHDEIGPPFVESSTTSDTRQTSGRRKSSNSWLRWLPGSKNKNKRSKSTPSIAMHRPGVHSRKQSVA